MVPFDAACAALHRAQHGRRKSNQLRQLFLGKSSVLPVLPNLLSDLYPRAPVFLHTFPHFCTDSAQLIVVSDLVLHFSQTHGKQLQVWEW